ncbi:OPT superfamily oligopeptide transporter [Testicularia cyperi]|uniref:OPT superfamily oligopeptide transporter n=1 Tax=Testicularia cyperi TaxID=1882483 RepID=A0A317XVJ0_9BASI|nr:OPT superfamily oligopeptide transporter [Testicularia cyperi]
MAAPTPTWGQMHNEANEITETHLPHYQEHHGLGDSNANVSDDEKKSSISSAEGVQSQLPVAGYYDSEKKAVTSDEDFVPEDPHKQFDERFFPEEQWQLTIRSLVVGTLLGCVIAASNVYLGLKTGFTFGASLFGAIIGFSIIKTMEKLLPTWLGGGFFGPRENCTVQTSATAAGSLTGMFVAAVPAMYQLNLLNPDPLKDFGRLLTFCAVSAYYGVFFAIPLRKFYILKQKLVFPSPTATAYTIRSLHAPGGEISAKKQSRALMYSFFGAFAFVVANQYASGILMDWHIFYWLYSWGWKKALVVDNWGWIIEWTPAFLGAGMLSGMNASYSFLGGSFLMWAMIGPSIIATGQATGKHTGIAEGADPVEPLRWNYFSMSFYPDRQPLNAASPRYWGLWPGVLMMFAYSFAELAMNGKTLYAGARAGFLEIYSKITRKELQVYEGAIEDPVKQEDQVPILMWTGGLLISIVFTCLVCTLQFHMNLGNVILAIILAFIFSFVGVQASGATDTNPLGTIAKASQLVVGGALRGQGKVGNAGLLENLIAGSIASSAAAHAVDMVGDLKTGHLLRAKPRVQFWAQCFGSFFSIFVSTGLFVLFTKAYPCIIDATVDECPFAAPAVSAWKIVALAVISPKLPVSLSSGLTAIGFAIIAIVTVIAKYKWIPARYHVYVPNWNAVGLGFVVPQTYYPIAMCMGASAGLIWKGKSPKSFDLLAYAIAAGLIAGEGMAGVFNAILTIIGVDGGIYGSSVGTPPWA